MEVGLQVLRVERSHRDRFAGNDNVVNFKAGATLGSNVLKVSVTSNAVNKYLYNRHFSV